MPEIGALVESLVEKGIITRGEIMAKLRKLDMKIKEKRPR